MLAVGVTAQLGLVLVGADDEAVSRSCSGRTPVRAPWRRASPRPGRRSRASGTGRRATGEATAARLAWYASTTRLPCAAREPC